MEKLSKYCPSLIFLIIMISSCKESDIVYKKQYSSEEKIKLSESILNGAGTDLYYQGTVSERQIIKEADILNSASADVQREYGVPYLKRGFAHEANKYYTEASKKDPLTWLGYKGYCWLYFYRDYETALREFNELDTLTPNFVDHPQATSIDYMRGICYLKLGNYDEAISMLKKHLKKEKEEIGANYIEALPYQLLGICYLQKKDYKTAQQYFEEGLEYNENIADLWYYQALNYSKMNELDKALVSLDKAEYYLLQGNYNNRNYVEEFYQIYIQDIQKLRKLLIT